MSLPSYKNSSSFSTVSYYLFLLSVYTVSCNTTIIFTKSITCKNAKTKPKSMLATENLINSTLSIHSHPPQNDDLILVLTHESVRNAILPFGKLCHTKQNHCANTFPSPASLLLYSLLHKVPLQEGQLFLRSSLLFPNIFVLL